MLKPKSKPALPAPLEWATLRQAVLWEARDLTPIEHRFEKLKGYPLSVEDENFSDAKFEVAKVLAHGHLRAYGREGSAPTIRCTPSVSGL